MAQAAEDRRDAADRAVEASVQGRGATSFHEVARIWAAEQGLPASWPEWQQAMRVCCVAFFESQLQARGV